MLPANDARYLTECGMPHAVTVESGMVCVTLPNFGLPAGYDVAQSDLLLRLHPGYPDVPPDMWWFAPAVRRADGGTITATELVENYLGRSWQRWSRHLLPGQWRSGIDGIENYLALVRRELQRSVTSLAA